MSAMNITSAQTAIVRCSCHFRTRYPHACMVGPLHSSTTTNRYRDLPETPEHATALRVHRRQKP